IISCIRPVTVSLISCPPTFTWQIYKLLPSVSSKKLWGTLRHHRKEGWPSDQENIAKHPLIARTGWFSDENKRKTTPSASASVASQNFSDDADTPPCGDARRESR